MLSTKYVKDLIHEVNPPKDNPKPDAQPPSKINHQPTSQTLVDQYVDFDSDDSCFFSRLDCDL